MASTGAASFQPLCSQAILPLCPMIAGDIITSTANWIPTCYARNIQINGRLIFEPATLAIFLIAILMTSFMILNIRMKQAAVGRLEMLYFFSLYLLTILFEFFLLSGIDPPGTNAYIYVAAAHIAFYVTTTWTLFYNGIVSFQLLEDGAPASLLLLFCSSIIAFVVTFVIAQGTFTNSIGFVSTSPTALWILYALVPLLFLFGYMIMQVTLVLRSLEDRWAVADIVLASAFFTTSALVTFVWNTSICTFCEHYVDGLFFGALFALLAVMMIYKYWNGITNEDLEFSVGGKPLLWELDVDEYQATPENGATSGSILPAVQQRSASFLQVDIKLKPRQELNLNSLNPGLGRKK